MSRDLPSLSGLSKLTPLSASLSPELSSFLFWDAKSRLFIASSELSEYICSHKSTDNQNYT